MTIIATPSGAAEFIPSPCRPPIMRRDAGGGLLFQPFGDCGMMEDILASSTQRYAFYGWQTLHPLLSDYLPGASQKG